MKRGNTSGSNLIEYEDGRSYDPNAVAKITQQWVDDHMKVREAEFTRSKTATVFVGTWNVNAKKEEGNLDAWLLPRQQSQQVADVYAVGFQEIVDLNAMNVALDSSKTQKQSQFWQEKISDCLISSGFKFTKIMEKHLVGLLLVIFVKDSIFPFIRDVRSATIGVGIMGLLGNKGGVAIRISLYDSSICFVCSHLAAHRENVVGRNSDFKNILQRLQFLSEFALKEDDDENSPYEPLAVQPCRGAALTQKLDLTVSDHEIVFWMGDLNYRMDENLAKETVFQLIDTKDLANLKKNDQLNIERLAGRVFQGFEEADITFYPTYKYQPGTDVYEQRPEKKLRAPAYCDRILWRTTNAPNSIRVLNYQSAKLNSSDHKPVYASFSADLREVIAESEKAVFNELMQKLESSKRNDQSVVADISGLQIKIADAKFEVPSTSQIQIKNPGNTLLYWHFLPKLEETKLSKRWISLDITSGLLLPSESVNITVTVLVDKKTAQAINQGRDTLDDILVLRVENCNDYFASVSASYMRSCYGMSLEELVHTLEPVYSTKLPALEFPDAIQNFNQSTPKLAIPKELWRLVDALWTGDGIREKDLFSTEADSLELADVRESIDANKDFPRCTPHAIAAAIIGLIDALPSPLLPVKHYPMSEVDPTNLKFFARKFLEALPPLNYTVFVYLMSFFREVLAQADYNRSTPAKLAEVCVGCMTPSSIDLDLSKEERDRRQTKQQFLLPVITHFLTVTSL